MMKKNMLDYLLNAVIFKITVIAASLAKFSFIVGSMTAFFSLSSAIVPLSGELAGVGGTLAFTLLHAIMHIILKGSFSWHFLAYYVPGLCAALYWSSSSKLMRVMPALVCMILFIAHPIGCYAALYTTFWLIPLYAALMPAQTIFMRALGATLTAHALGSVIWLYTIGLSADQWLMLMPIVVLERLALAVATTFAYAVLKEVKKGGVPALAGLVPSKS